MKQYILFIFLFIPLFSSCQEKYNQEPYDKEEIRLREANASDTILQIQKDWEKRDSLSYLRFKNTNRITLIEVDSIPDWINSFKSLKYISSLGQDSIRYFPQNLESITNLRTIGFNNVKFNIIPESFYEQQNLLVLGLRGGNKTIIDTSINNLTKLEYLSLFDFKKIPIDNICKIYSLKLLNIDRCKLTNLPKSIKNLINLEELSIKSNNITELPKELLELPKLREISYDEDKITDEDFKKKLYEHVEKNRVAYLKQQMKEERKKYQNSKK